jgi:hypothetical protein
MHHSIHILGHFSFACAQYILILPEINHNTEFRLYSSGLLRCIVSWLYTDVSEQRVPSIIMVEDECGMFLQNFGVRPEICLN